jgi:4'-phosphopantetheinyl transferase
LEPLAPSEVRVFTLADTLGGDDRARLLSLLDEDEKARSARRRVASDRESFELAHALVRLALSSAAPVEPAAWRFRYDERGRPEVDSPAGLDQLRFSLSHARGLVACAIAGDGREVGVDAEDLERRELEDAHVQQLCFSPEEIAALDPCSKVMLFTLKEAYAKARGLGLALDLRSFRVALSPPALSIAPPGDDASSWLLALQPVAPKHAVAVAARRGAGEVLDVRFLCGLPAS